MIWIIGLMAWAVFGMIAVEACRLGRFWDLTMTPLTIALCPVILIASITQKGSDQ